MQGKRKKWTFEDFTLDGAMGACIGFHCYFKGVTDYFQGA